jgi:CII-binding regulator of phage lambda lysogenization HflD
MGSTINDNFLAYNALEEELHTSQAEVDKLKHRIWELEEEVGIYEAVRDETLLRTMGGLHLS